MLYEWYNVLCTFCGLYTHNMCHSARGFGGMNTRAMNEQAVALLAACAFEFRMTLSPACHSFQNQTVYACLECTKTHTNWLWRDSLPFSQSRFVVRGTLLTRQTRVRPPPAWPLMGHVRCHARAYAFACIQYILSCSPPSRACAVVRASELRLNTRAVRRAHLCAS